jgi:putative endonuclease
MSNYSKTLYVGVTNNLERRVLEHKSKLVEGFSKQYSITKLVHAEECGEIEDAIAREEEIKGWRREKKVTLIKASNPKWEDLGGEFGSVPVTDSSLRSE